MRRWLIALGLTAITWWAWPAASESVRVVSFNIERFPKGNTDVKRVADTIVEVDADFVAVQEIRNPRRFVDVLEDAALRAGRGYRFMTSACGGDGRKFTTGIVWDADKWRLTRKRDYPGLQPDGNGSCGNGQPGILGVFERIDGEERLVVLSVHFFAYARNYPRRQEQWRRVIQILKAAEQDYAAPVVAVGDFNTNGFRGEPAQERPFIEGLLNEAGFHLPSADIPCTQYWQPDIIHGAYSPYVLDHMVATTDHWGPARPAGMCERLACKHIPTDEMDPDYFRVSDHCPVVVEAEL